MLTKHVLNFCFSLPVVGRTVPAQEILLNLVYCPLPQHFNYSFRYRGEKKEDVSNETLGETPFLPLPRAPAALLPSPYPRFPFSPCVTHPARGRPGRRLMYCWPFLLRLPSYCLSSATPCFTHSPSEGSPSRGPLSRSLLLHVAAAPPRAVWDEHWGWRGFGTLQTPPMVPCSPHHPANDTQCPQPTKPQKPELLQVQNSHPEASFRTSKTRKSSKGQNMPCPSIS